MRSRRLVPRAVAGVLAVVALGLAGPAHADGGPTNDTGSALQWHLGAIGAPAAWPVSTGRGTTIAIVDSGVDLAHADLQGGRITAAVTCMGTGGDSSKCVTGGQDDDGHGTHVAGIAAATANNGIGVAGVAPDADLFAVKVLSEQCTGPICDASGSSGDVTAGIVWAADHGATVINLSLGSSTQSVFGPSFSAAIEYAWKAGSIPVVAAGNDFVVGSGFSNEPAIVVGALNRSGTKASYSSGVGSAHWAISAPGGELDDTQSCKTAPAGILSTYWVSGKTDQYACLAGTSMAAPQVAAAAAILRSAGLSPTATVERLLNTAHDIGSAGRDSTYGAGALDLAAATAGLTATTAGATPAADPSLTPATDVSSPSVTTATRAPTTAPPAPPAATDASDAPDTTGVPTTRRAAGALATLPASSGDDPSLLVVLLAGLLAAGVGTAGAVTLARRAATRRA